MYNAFTSSPFDLLAQVHEAQFSGRVLVNRDIYDIAALCSDQQKPFFGACGFGDDVLVSTTMMYTRSASTHSEDEQMVKCAGRKLLLVPSLRGNLKI
uniref:Uncharacterized protein n=1 Tax=Solanum tuberosum TaxID=4113 RepID=M1AU94_SOLTU